MSKYALPVTCNSANPSNLGTSAIAPSFAPQLPQNFKFVGFSNPHFLHLTFSDILSPNLLLSAYPNSLTIYVCISIGFKYLV